MRFKELANRVIAVGQESNVSPENARWIDSLLSGDFRDLSKQEHETIAQLFWNSARSAEWSHVLSKHIITCPKVVVVQGGYQAPRWFADSYVRRQIQERSERIFNLLLR